MLQNDKTVGVFVSSTFHDMHAERDHLVTVVFPELRERLATLELDLHDVDLRWGVPETDADGELANSWEYCKKAIQRTKPLFIGLLGHRYGHIPNPSLIQDPRNRARWGGLSITEMEVRFALEEMSRRAFFYLRQTRPDSNHTNFADRSSHQVDALRAYFGRTQRPVREYQCCWNETASRFENLDDFGQLVLQDLWCAILRDRHFGVSQFWRKVRRRNPDDDPLFIDESKSIPEDVWQPLVALSRPAPVDPWDAEQMQMSQFSQTRLRWFRGRDEELERVRGFLLGNDGNGLCVLKGPPGQGKSALMAQIAQDAARDADVLAHFVGATESSVDVRSLLARLNVWLDRRGVPGASDPETRLDLRRQKELLAERLREYSGKRRLVLVLDALNQMSSGHELGWLPMRLGPDVRIVVSCVEDPNEGDDSPAGRVLSALRSRDAVTEWVELGPLREHDVRSLVEDYLAEFQKELSKEQVATIASLPRAGNPLYLRVMLDQLRTLGGDDMHRHVPDLISRMPQERPGTLEMFEWVLEGLETGFGHDQVAAWCKYLALGRVGMSSAELTNLLEARFGIEGGRTALRIERGMRRYLQRRGRQLDFFHGQLMAAVDRRFQIDDLTARHAEIAAVLNTGWRRDEPDRHSLRELPHHLVQAQDSDGLLATLADEEFLRRKAEAVGPEAVVDDFVSGYQLLKDVSADRAAQLIETFGRALARREGTEDGGFNLENVNAWLQYSQDYVLLEALLRQDETVAADAERAADYLALCRAYLAEHLRRNLKRLDEALEVAEAIPTDITGTRALKAASLAKYQAGYIMYLQGRLEHAIDALWESVEFSVRAEDMVGEWISRCVHKRFEWLVGKANSAAFKEVLEHARLEFERHADTDPRAARWRVHNVEGHLIEIAFAEGDAKTARNSLEQVRLDGWETTIERRALTLWHEARVAMIEKKWNLAVQVFETVPQGKTEAWLDLDRDLIEDHSEALAEKYLAYGIALEGAGQPSDAKRAWRCGLKCPVQAGNAIWHVRIRQKLERLHRTD